MTENIKKHRDILDVSSPGEAASARPTVEPDTGRFFLDKFLSEAKDAEREEKASREVVKADGPVPENAADLEALIITFLQEIFDPEIPVNIYELGLIYGVDVTDSFDVIVRMTLTTPNCPVAESMPGDVEMKVRSVPGVRNVEVQLVWEPPWDMSLMSDAAQLELGLL